MLGEYSSSGEGAPASSTAYWRGRFVRWRRLPRVQHAFCGGLGEEGRAVSP